MIHVMEVLDPTGHLTLQWDPEDTEAIAKARDEFDRLKAVGYTFYSVPVEVTDFGSLEERDVLEVRRTTTTADTKPRRGRPPKAPSDGTPEGPIKEFEPKSKRTVAVPRMQGG